MFYKKNKLRTYMQNWLILILSETNTNNKLLQKCLKSSETELYQDVSLDKARHNKPLCYCVYNGLMNISIHTLTQPFQVQEDPCKSVGCVQFLILHSTRQGQLVLLPLKCMDNTIQMHNWLFLLGTNHDPIVSTTAHPWDKASTLTLSTPLLFHIVFCTNRTEHMLREIRVLLDLFKAYGIGNTFNIILYPAPRSTGRN